MNDANERMEAAVGVGTATKVAGLRCFPPRPNRRGNAIRLGIQAYVSNLEVEGSKPNLNIA